MPKFPWRDLVEKIVKLASATARVETSIKMAHVRSTVPIYNEFKSLVMRRAKEITKGREPYLQKEFAPFNSYFNQCIMELAKGNEPSLENIIKKEYDKL